MSRQPIPDAAAGSGVKTRSKGPHAPPRPCAVCGTMFAPHKKRAEARFCSGECVWLATKGAEFNAQIARDSAEARGDAQRGRGAGKTYRKRNGRHEHRLVAEQKLGRPLLPGEIVHHDDEHIQNNALDNLEVMPSQSDHARLHFTGKKHSPEHIKKRIEARMRTIHQRRVQA